MSTRRKKLARRHVLQGGLAAAALGSAASLGLGCKNKRKPSPAEPARAGDAAAAASPRADLTALVLALGPWTATQAADARHFVERYVTGERLARFAEAAGAIHAVVARLPPGARALDEIDLDEYSERERRALMDVLHDLYGIQEVRFFIAGQPPPGTCMGNLEWHTRAPDKPT